MKHTVLAAAILAAYGYAYTLTAADKINPLLATAKTAYVFPGDALKDDQPVANCFSEQLTKLTPYTAAGKDEAEIHLRVWADISGDWKKMMGTLGMAGIVATAPDGTKVWSGAASIMTSEVGTRRLSNSEVACALATEIADKLRGAMRKSRDKK